MLASAAITAFGWSAGSADPLLLPEHLHHTPSPLLTSSTSSWPRPASFLLAGLLMAPPTSSSSERSSSGIGCLQKRKESYWLLDVCMAVSGEKEVSVTSRWLSAFYLLSVFKWNWLPLKLASHHNQRFGSVIFAMKLRAHPVPDGGIGLLSIWRCWSISDWEGRCLLSPPPVCSTHSL